MCPSSPLQSTGALLSAKFVLGHELIGDIVITHHTQGTFQFEETDHILYRFEEFSSLITQPNRKTRNNPNDDQKQNSWNHRSNVTSAKYLSLYPYNWYVQK